MKPRTEREWGSTVRKTHDPDSNKRETEERSKGREEEEEEEEEEKGISSVDPVVSSVRTTKREFETSISKSWRCRTDRSSSPPREEESKDKD